MIIYIRTKNNVSLFEVEVYKNDQIEVVPHIYSNKCFIYLLKNCKNKSYVEKFITEFKPLEELRGWYHEIYVHSKEPQDLYSVINKLRDMLSDIAVKLDLDLVED